jgi:hypothetical protein
MLLPPRPPPAGTPPQQRRGKSRARDSLYFPFMHIPLNRRADVQQMLSAMIATEATSACCREETPDSTFNSPRTLSPFIKGDAFRC